MGLNADTENTLRDRLSAEVHREEYTAGVYRPLH